MIGSDYILYKFWASGDGHKFEVFQSSAGKARIGVVGPYAYLYNFKFAAYTSYYPLSFIYKNKNPICLDLRIKTDFSLALSSKISKVNNIEKSFVL